MAVYQYYLGVVPKQGIERRYGSIPDRIGVGIETEYFESDAEIYWEEVEMKADDFITKIDLIIKRANWGNNNINFHWKTYSQEFDNDASIYLDEKSLTIREFSFRADLRENNLSFLKNMIELAIENEWLLFDRKGKLMKPDFEEIKNSIKNSYAYHFLEDPIKFLENIKKTN